MRLLLSVLILLIGVAAEVKVDDHMEGVREITSTGAVTKGKWFVLFYNSDCGFCKRVAAEWKLLGEDHPSDVVIAKLNAGSYQTPEYVSGYPTIVLYQFDTDNKLQWKEYDNHANRDRHHFIEFINNNGLPTPSTSESGTTSTDQPPSEAPVWYYIWFEQEEKASDALKPEQVIELVKNGEIKPTTLMAKAGDQEWVEANALNFVASLFTEGFVAGLTDSTFEDRVSDGKFWMVAVVVPECGFCKRLWPEWEALGEYYSDSIDVGIGRVNAEVSPRTAASLDASGFPTIIGFTPDGQKVQFTDHQHRTKERFISFIQEMQRQFDESDEL
eukprot:TRINITY_DN12648_c0_g1_i1.p1 TRINITY_DN12648_c0_g1~~TRINITY_DN12648_c0_g1_i1.p1  ORF type:complete len:329 (+),score=93.68 TRINITY_DN12648_c0_g1_i1:151-1137(+)